MALNVWMVGFVVIGIIAIIFGTGKWVWDLVTSKIDSAIPCIRTFVWEDDIIAIVTLTDGTKLRGACGVWSTQGKYISDLGLRIALRKRYNDEMVERNKSTKDDDTK